MDKRPITENDLTIELLHLRIQLFFTREGFVIETVCCVFIYTRTVLTLALIFGLNLSWMNEQRRKESKLKAQVESLQLKFQFDKSCVYY